MELIFSGGTPDRAVYAIRRVALSLLSLAHTSDGSGDGDGSGSYRLRLRLRPSENRYDGSGDGSLTFVFSIIKTTFKLVDEKDAILLLFVFILFRPRRRRRRLAQLKKKENFLGKTTVCRPKNVWGILDFGFADERNGS